jgi:hypothetical protein
VEISPACDSAMVCREPLEGVEPGRKAHQRVGVLPAVGRAAPGCRRGNAMEGNSRRVP